MKNAPVLHRIEYGLFAALRGVLGLVPHQAARSVGTALGDLLWLALPQRRRVALSNIEHAFPDLDQPETRQLAILSCT